MSRSPRNPFYVILGIVGFAFTITAAAYCVSVLRGIRPETRATSGGHPLERIMDLHGTTILTVELAILAIATVGAIWLDHRAGERIRQERESARARERDSDPSGSLQP
jgi:hypothetical protein